MKKRSKTRRKKLQKHAGVLVVREDFRREVKKLRKKWDIPENGFKNFQGHQRWTASIQEKRKEEKCDYIEAEWVLGIKGPKINPSGCFKRRIEPPSPFFQFLNDIADLCWSLDLSSKWSQFVRFYILFNRETYTPFDRTPRISLVARILGEHMPREFIRLEFGVDTTQKDIEAVWGKIKELKKQMRGFKTTQKRRKRTLARDYFIFEFFKAWRAEWKSMSLGDIYRELPEWPWLGGRELSEEAFGKIIKRMEKETKPQRQ